jgi:hypothetical protein
MVLVATVCGRSWHAREVPAPRRCCANASVAATERFVLVGILYASASTEWRWLRWKLSVDAIAGGEEGLCHVTC